MPNQRGRLARGPVRSHTDPAIRTAIGAREQESGRTDAIHRMLMLGSAQPVEIDREESS